MCQAHLHALALDRSAMVVCSWLSKAQCTSAAALGTGSTAVDELQWVSFIGDRCLSQLLWAQPAQHSHAGQAVLAAGLHGHHADQARLCCHPGQPSGMPCQSPSLHSMHSVLHVHVQGCIGDPLCPSQACRRSGWSSGTSSHGLTQHSLQAMLQRAGIRTMLNELSSTVVFERPSEEAFIRKWQLACEGDIAHVVVMPNITIDKMETFVQALIESRCACGAAACLCRASPETSTELGRFLDCLCADWLSSCAWGNLGRLQTCLSAPRAG